MRTKGARTEKINVVTLGCSKNIYDSEVLMAQLKANQFSVEHESETEDFDTVIINTCGFIDNAKEESVNTILQFSDAKKKGWVEKVIVTGCLSERYKEDLEKEIPEVDAWFGTRDLPRLLKTLKADYKHELVGERFLTTPIHYAYLKISEGCDRPCTFCAIPLMRGKHKSTPIEDLVKQAKSLAAQGTRELILIAQDSTYYGLDIYGKRNLAALLQRLSEVEGIDWIRLHYAYPSGFPMDVIQEMAKNPKICNYLDIPLQHINDDMLKSMKRVTTREKTDRILNEMRSINPEMGIRTTLITGFPGETLEQFNEMRDWVAEMKFDRLGVFTYSHEENTGAYVLEDNVPQEEKQRRADEIMSIQEGISQELNDRKIGSTQKILIDRKEGGFYVGRSEYDSPEVDNEVYVSAEEHFLRVGDFVNIKITSSTAFDLEGEPV
ncbi:MAG: 30S ribosomal protein S12 methylthiotransferase RimO [Flavobacteriales bacterium]|jgi:ribosomal protein S12 methylthiotransferase|nr:30S ribosomal protein S12 methylthiotransferase RimO [Flavobacteriales bacterium]MBT3964869.1 30S ribosomal protein S12 methylthiotransferase RimO [Flavobacteriales bacterium]MBT4704067.1 30S ribosomal protein S12 methylthiotransferase RimO [Flavobacteriales bacterium]MBT4930714.1 30S ribosomal protein S12 methylthiotransferase RimO [Flavobacteriales bacterium]MBT5132047.1 30S ribosomal protein S12 methylthiotransferase RimO [Flavobacteriales bacterium]